MSSFSGATISVSWVLSRLNKILSIAPDDREGSGGGQARPPPVELTGRPIKSIMVTEQSMAEEAARQKGEGESIRRAIWSLKREISTDHSAGVTFTIKEMTTARLTSYFGVKIPSRRELLQNELKLSKYHPVREVPPQLKINIDRLARSDRYDCSDISSRLAADLIIFECQVVLADTYTEFLKDPDPHSLHNYRSPENPPPSVHDRELPCRILPNIDLSVTVKDPSTNAPVTIGGTAEWVLRWNPDGVLGYYAAIKVVTPDEFSSAENQLVASLAIIRQCQIQAHGSAMGIDGFYTDGAQYVFICVSSENMLHRSRVYEIWRPGDLKIIYNYALYILFEQLKYLGC